MTNLTIPVDPRNPGHVLACLGLLEAAAALGCADAGGFSDGGNRFHLTGDNSDRALPAILAFLLHAELREITTPAEVYPAAQIEPRAWPLLLCRNNFEMRIDHWADRSSRWRCKFYAGSNSGARLFREMAERTKNLLHQDREAFLERPFQQLAPTASCFNFDATGTSSSLDVGFDRDVHKDHSGNNRLTSPFVEMLAPIGLQNARPSYTRPIARYAVWLKPLPPALARAAFAGTLAIVPAQLLSFEVVRAGQYSFATYAVEDRES